MVYVRDGRSLGAFLVFLGKKMKKNPTSIINRAKKDPQRKARFERKYADFLLSEVLLELMQGADISIRVLRR